MKLELAPLREIEKERAIPLEMLLVALEDALSAAYKRIYGTLDNVKIHIDRDTLEMVIVEEKEVVPRVKDKQIQISLTQAKKIKADVEAGDIIQIRKEPGDFGRIAAQTAKQVIVQRIREAERDIVYDELMKKVGQVVSVQVHRFEQRNVIMDMGKSEGYLPVSEQVPGEHFRHGERIKCYVMEIRKTPRGPLVVLSRAHPQLIVTLFEMEVPEISSDVIEIVNVAREPGHRSKIAVYSKDPGIDAVGACVGPRGSRVQAVVDELRGEKLDIINYNEDPTVFICNALSPAKILKVTLNEEQLAKVVVQDNMLSLAIGKEGQNARLAAKLTGWKIDIKSQSQAEAVKAEETQREAEFKKQKQDELKRKEEAWKLKEEEAKKAEKELAKLIDVEVKEEVKAMETAVREPELIGEAELTKKKREESPEYLALLELETALEAAPEIGEEPAEEEIEEWKWEEVLEEVSKSSGSREVQPLSEEEEEEEEKEEEITLQSLPTSTFDADQLGYAPTLPIDAVFEAESIRGKSKAKKHIFREVPDEEETFNVKSRGKKSHKPIKKKKRELY
ncbi:MAG: transcription termination factor NusA [Chloroflexi bacterium]|nr:transcription termination factor NusA [Chloroflexota bacterium]